jgi:hypothetical protein
VEGVPWSGSKGRGAWRVPLERVIWRVSHAGNPLERVPGGGPRGSSVGGTMEGSSGVVLWRGSRGGCHLEFQGGSSM